jgi:hypothetical protein
VGPNRGRWIDQVLIPAWLPRFTPPKDMDEDAIADILCIPCVCLCVRLKVPSYAESPPPVSLSGDLSGAKMCQVLDSIFGAGSI